MMASLSFDGLDEMVARLGAAGEGIDKHAPQILLKGAGPLKDQIMHNIYKNVSPGSSGQLFSSVKIEKPRKSKNGAWSVKVAFTGYDKKTGVANDRKAMSLEYGTSRQTANPIIGPAVAKTEKLIFDIMSGDIERILSGEYK